MGVGFDDAKELVSANLPRISGDEDPDDVAYGLLETAQRRAELFGYGAGPADLAVAGKIWCVLPNTPPKSPPYEQYMQHVRRSLFRGASTTPEVLSQVPEFFSHTFLSTSEDAINLIMSQPPEWRQILNAEFVDKLASQGTIALPPDEPPGMKAFH